jgi:hypothetical protein
MKEKENSLSLWGADFARPTQKTVQTVKERVSYSANVNVLQHANGAQLLLVCKDDNLFCVHAIPVCVSAHGLPLSTLFYS